MYRTPVPLADRFADYPRVYCHPCRIAWMGRTWFHMEHFHWRGGHSDPDVSQMFKDPMPLLRCRHWFQSNPPLPALGWELVYERNYLYDFRCNHPRVAGTIRDIGQPAIQLGRISQFDLPTPYQRVSQLRHTRSPELHKLKLYIRTDTMGCLWGQRLHVEIRFGSRNQFFPDIAAASPKRL